MRQHELPNDWQLMRLGDIVSVKGGKRLPKGASFASGVTQHPYLRIVDFANGQVRIGDLRYLSDEVHEAIKQYTINKNDVYLSIAGTIGLAGVIPDKLDGANLTENAAKLVLKTAKCLRDFLALYLVSPQCQKQITDLTVKTTQPKLALARIERINVPIPRLPEQRAIAHILRAVQAAREARQREVSLGRERKAALMAHLFTHGTRGEPTKQTPIGEMPESWEMKGLGEVCDIRYGLGQPPELDEDGVPMIRATDIKAGRIVSEGVVRVKREAIPRGRNPFLEVGDVIVVRSGAYTGDVAVYDGRWESAIVGYDLVARPKNERVNPAYVASFLLSERGARYFRSQRDRSAQPHLNAEQLRKAVLPFPPPTEQKEVADLSKACDAKIAALERESALLDELFRALLEELMTGRVSVAGQGERNG